MNVGRGVAASLLAGVVLAWLTPAVAFACSPPFEEPTIRALGSAQVVVIGTTGERVAGGRAFHVERWFNGDMPPAGMLVIAFKEGEPLGDCSYPVSAGTRLIIAPYREADGRLSADLVTLQADPTSETGRKYVAEATALFGPGVAIQAGPDVPEGPESSDPQATPAPDAPAMAQPPWAIFIVALIGVVLATATLSGRVRAGLQRRRPPPGS